LELSDKGNELMSKVFPLHKKKMRSILDTLDEDEETVLQKALVKLGKTGIGKKI
jgi:DNA-binding MarR family transcriptional regulator